MLHEIATRKKNELRREQTKTCKKRSQISARVINLHCVQPRSKKAMKLHDMKDEGEGEEEMRMLISYKDTSLRKQTRR